MRYSKRTRNASEGAGMSDTMDKTRLLVAKRVEEDRPLVIAAVPEDMWEILPPEEWEVWKEQRAQELLEDWTAYDYIEVVVTIPSAQLAAMFEAREIAPTSVVLVAALDAIS
jgi:hypothetical protein